MITSFINEVKYTLEHCDKLLPSVFCVKTYTLMSTLQSFQCDFWQN